MEELTLKSEAHNLIYSIESLLTNTLKLKESILLNDASTLVESVTDEKQQLNQLTQKSRQILSTTGKDIAAALNSLKSDQLLVTK